MLLSPTSWLSEPPNSTGETMGMLPYPIHQIPALPRFPGQENMSRDSSSITAIPERAAQQGDPASTSPFSAERTSTLASVDEDSLVNAFLQMLMPPILTPVEIGPKWASTRAFFGIMAAESPVVRSAIMAFAAMQMQRTGLGADGVAGSDWRSLYDNAARQLSTALARKSTKAVEEHKKDSLKHVLAALFLLTYTDVSAPCRRESHSQGR